MSADVRPPSSPSDRSQHSSPSPSSSILHLTSYPPSSLGVVDLPHPPIPLSDLDSIPAYLKPSLRDLLLSIQSMRRRLAQLEDFLTNKADAHQRRFIVSEYAQSDLVLGMLEWRYKHEISEAKHSPTGWFKTMLGYEPLADGFVKAEPESRKED